MGASRESGLARSSRRADRLHAGSGGSRDGASAPRCGRAGQELGCHLPRFSLGMRTGSRVGLLCALLFALGTSVVQGQTLRDTVERYSVDRDALARRYAVSYSPARSARFRTFYTEWLSRVTAVPYEKLDVE